MSFKFKSFLHVFILVAMGLGCPAQNVQAMKRVHESEEVAASSSASSVAEKIYTISDLTTDPLRKIFAMVNKATIGRVCTLWADLSLFQSNWKTFCYTYPKDLVMSPRDYQRMYYLLLKADDVKGLEGLLAVDPNRENNVESIAPFLRLDSVEIPGSDDMRQVLTKYGVSVIKVPSHVTDRRVNVACPDREKTKPFVQGEELEDIVLRNDMQALGAFIAAGKETGYAAKAIARFGTVVAIEKLIAHWKTHESIAPTNVCGEAVKNLRVDVVRHLLLSELVDMDGLDEAYDPVTCAFDGRDYVLFDLLCKHGVKLSNSAEFCVDLDEHGNLDEKTGQQYDVTPLIYAVFYQDPLLVNILFKYGGVDPFEVNRNSLIGDALALAKRLGNREIIECIETARAVEKNVLARSNLKGYRA
jgi:hypothetical protein